MNSITTCLLNLTYICICKILGIEIYWSPCCFHRLHRLFRKDLIQMFQCETRRPEFDRKRFDYVIMDFFGANNPAGSFFEDVVDSCAL